MRVSNNFYHALIYALPISLALWALIIGLVYMFFRFVL